MAIVVDSLIVYPLKSGGGVSVDRMECTDRGPRWDRRWMIVDELGRFISQRTDPKLANVALSLGTNGVVATLDGYDVALEAPTGEGDRNVSVWRQEVAACDLGDEPAAAFTEFLGRTVHVVYMSDENRRAANPAYAGDDQLVSFADGYPYLVTNVGSLDDLNARAQTDLKMGRFRPNIVVRGAAPWAEDDWTTVRIGEVEFELVKPCARCSMTTIDPKTGEFDGPEPLRTLATFRRQDGEVMFGWNAIGPGTGTIRVGDTVEPIG